MTLPAAAPASALLQSPPVARVAGRADPVVGAAGDIACASATPTPSSCHQKATSDLLVGKGLSAVLAIGDEQYEHGELSNFNAYYDPTWGRVKSITHPVPGNHEYETSGASGYYTYFGSLAGDASKGYYSFNIGAWHIVALNSNCSVVSCSTGSTQEKWLKSDLATHTNKCTLAYFHHPRWSSGTPGTSVVGPFITDLYNAGADLVLAGHAHHYERFAPQNPSGQVDNTKGLGEIVVGTGGRSLSGFGTPAPNSLKRSMTFGVIQLTLRSSSFVFKFVPEAGASFTDSGTVNCH